MHQMGHRIAPKPVMERVTRRNSRLLRRILCSLSALIVTFTLASAFAGTLHLLGPDQRNEGPLPAVPADERGTFKVDVFAEGFEGFAGIQILLDLPLYGFQIVDDATDEATAALPSIELNTKLLGEVYLVQNGPMVAMMVIGRQEDGQPLSIDIPSSTEKTSASTQTASSASDGLTWLMSIPWSYDNSHAGTFAVNVVPCFTLVADERCGALSYNIVPGCITIGQSGPTNREKAAVGEGTLLTELTGFLATGFIQADATGDGNVNILDLIYVRNYFGGQVTDRDTFAADVNGDDLINILDLVAIQNKLNLQEPVDLLSIEFVLVDAATGEELETFPLLDSDLWGEHQNLMSYLTPFEDLFYKFSLRYGVDLLIKTTIETASVAANCDIRWIQLDENGDPLTEPGSRALWELEEETPISSLTHNPDSTLTFTQRIVGYSLAVNPVLTMQTYRNPAEPLLGAGPSIGIQMAPPPIQLTAYGTLQTVNDPAEEVFRIGHRDLQSSIALLDPVTGLPGDEWYWHWTVEAVFPEPGLDVYPPDSYDGLFVFTGSFPENVDRISYAFYAELYTFDESEEVVIITGFEFYIDVIDISGWTYEITNRNMGSGEDGIITGTGEITIPDVALEWGPLPLSFAFGPNVCITVIDPNGAELTPAPGEEITALHTHYDFIITPIETDSGWSESITVYLAGRDARAYYMSYDKVGFTYIGIEFDEPGAMRLGMMSEEVGIPELYVARYVVVHYGEPEENGKLQKGYLYVESFRYDEGGSRLPLEGDLSVSCGTGDAEIALWDNADPPNPQGGECIVTEYFPPQEGVYEASLAFWVQGLEEGRKIIVGGYGACRDRSEVIVYKYEGEFDLDISGSFGIGYPRRNSDEEEKEDVEDSPGAIIRVGGAFAPLIFQLKPVETPLQEITVNVQYDDEKLSIWKKPEGEDSLAVGGHSVADLGITGDGSVFYHTAIFFVQANAPSDAKGDLRITFSAEFDNEEHSDSVKVTALRFNLKEVTFSGQHMHPVIQDNNTPYENGPQWQDNSDPPNGNGQAKDAGDRRFPLCFTKGSSMLASANMEMQPVMGDQVKIKGVACSFDVQLNHGPSIPEALATIDGTTVTTAATEASSAFATNFREPMEIDWQFSSKTGEEDWTEWVSTGVRSDNRAYILRQEPAGGTTLFESVLEIACSGIPVHQDDDSVVEAIWRKFKTLDVRRKKMDGHNVEDGVRLRYWINNQIAASVAELLLKPDGNGGCGAWARLFRDTLAVHNIPSQIRVMQHPDGMQTYGLLVKNWKFGKHILTGVDGFCNSPRQGPNDVELIKLGEGNPAEPNKPCIAPGKDGELQSQILQDDQEGDGIRRSLGYPGADVYPYLKYLPFERFKMGDAVPGKSLPAQGNAQPTQEFDNHSVVLYGGAIHDPSYGVRVEPQGGTDVELLYERKAIEGLWQDLDWGIEIKKKDPDVKELQWSNGN